MDWLESSGFKGLYGRECSWRLAVDVDFDIVVLMNVEGPALKPFQIYQIAYEFLLLLVEDAIPRMKFTN